jgi:hypothetical protein
MQAGQIASMAVAMWQPVIMVQSAMMRATADGLVAMSESFIEQTRHDRPNP